MPTLTHIDHLVLTVKDIETTVTFYETRLGMTAAPFQVGAETRMALNFGTQKINLHQQGQEFEPKAAVPMPGSADLCFITKAPLEDWQDALGDLIIDGPVARTGASGPMTSIYLRDPDQNLIEIAKYI